MRAPDASSPFTRRFRHRAILLIAIAGLSAWLLGAAPGASADPPVFSSPPPNITVEASDSTGAYVDFAIPVANDDNGTPDVSCDANPGDLFPVGETTVTCTATDVVTDETSSTSFQIDVLAHAQEEASSGSVRALFYYTKTKNPARLFKNLSLTILRGGALAFSAPVSSYPSQPKLPAYPAGFGGKSSVVVRDLDADGEPEVLLDLYWGGAHCCFWTDIYRYNGSGYSLTHHFWGDFGYRLVDLNRDGRPEFVSADDRFAYAFSAFAFSIPPIQIWSYQSSRFTIVTRRYPDQIRRDATRAWRFYRYDRRHRYDTEGAVAAWAADEYLLGHRAIVWRRIKPLVRAGKLQGNYSSRKFPSKLRHFLAHNGYG